MRKLLIILQNNEENEKLAPNYKITKFNKHKHMKCKWITNGLSKSILTKDQFIRC